MFITDISKHIMYDFYCNHLKQEYADRVCNYSTRTDLLLLYVETEDIYKNTGRHADLYDTTSPLHSMVNKKVLGKMKN